MYLGKREYISCDGKIDAITGVANVPEIDEKLRGKYVFASLVCSFRHGREEDEMMGVSFNKELVVDRVQLWPNNENSVKQSGLQERLVQKLGMLTARPFALHFPPTAPNSVIIRGDEGDNATMGVSYEVRVHIGDRADDHMGQKKSTVSMSIRKVIEISFGGALIQALFLNTPTKIKYY